jgi:hypothetical protein
VRIYACYSDSHRSLLEKHFLPSIPEGFDVVLRKHDQHCPTGEFNTAGWDLSMLDKVRFRLEAIENEPEPVILCDVDVRFYGLSVGEAMAWASKADLLCQDDGTELCTGFMILRRSALTRALFLRVLSTIRNVGREQPALNAAVVSMFELRALKLPRDRFWTAGLQDGVWDGHSPIAQAPAGMVVHHANWVKGTDRKLAMLDAVWKSRQGETRPGG